MNVESVRTRLHDDTDRLAFKAMGTLTLLHRKSALQSAIADMQRQIDLIEDELQREDRTA